MELEMKSPRRFKPMRFGLTRGHSLESSKFYETTKIKNKEEEEVLQRLAQILPLNHSRSLFSINNKRMECLLL